jgi:hypothetical protein
MQAPRLYLGLMGFDAASENAVRRWLTKYVAESEKHAAQQGDSYCAWEVVDFREADALLIRGAGVTRCTGSQVEFHPSLRQSNPNAPLAADLDGIARPFALSDAPRLQMLGLQGKPYPSFDFADASTISSTLQNFEVILRPLRALFALALEMVDRREELQSEHTYHLERNGRLDAIIDPSNRRVFLRFGARPADVHGSTWMRRPKSANFVPESFLECQMDELAWIFAMHFQSTDLPRRYQKKPIYLRRNPRLRDVLLYPRHVALVDRLWQKPQTLEQLCRAFPESAHWMERDVYGLYLMRCISTTAPEATSEGNSSLPADDQDKWLLQRIGDHAHTMKAELKPLF